jgi:hypothetical protein
MSTHSHTDQPDPGPSRGGRRAKAAKAVAAAAAIAALAFGANAITNGTASSATSSGAQSAQAPPAGPPGTGTPRGMGTPVTGAALTRLKAAATAKYPGTVERAMKLSDGSYVVHVFQSNGNGEVRVLVSKDLKVTGVQQGGPRRGAPPAGSTAPSGTTPSTPS